MESSKKVLTALEDFNTLRKVITLDTWENSTLNIIDYVDLSAYLNIPIHVLANVYKNKSKLTSKIVLDEKRVVYKSEGILSYIQDMIRDELNKFYALIDTTHLLAYIPGKNYLDSIREISGRYELLISLDIKKYYDSISKDHIMYTLQTLCGFNLTTAKMFTHLTTVQRKHPLFNYVGNYLQQGSSASSVISNLVGYLFIDNVIFDIIDNLQKEQKIDINYFRYCDNLYIGVKNISELFNIKDIISKIRGSLQEVQLLTHKVHIVSKNHPKIAQKILGVTVNNNMKIGAKDYDYKRRNMLRMLYNTPYSVIKELVDIYNKSSNSSINPLVDTDILGKAFIGLDILNAQVNYINMVNKEQGRELINIASIISNILNFISKFPMSTIRDYMVYVDDTKFSSIKSRLQSVIQNSATDPIMKRKINNMLHGYSYEEHNNNIVIKASTEQQYLHNLLQRINKGGLVNIVNNKTLEILCIIPAYKDTVVQVPFYNELVDIITFIKQSVKSKGDIIEDSLSSYIATSLLELDIYYGVFPITIEVSDRELLMSKINRISQEELNSTEGLILSILSM